MGATEDVKNWSDEELMAFLASGGATEKDDVSLDVEILGEKALDSPSFLATEILDKWYKKHFEKAHYELMDEVLAPWILGETCRIEGINYNPRDYTGIIVLWARGTIKSTVLRMMVLWDALYKKYRQDLDARTAFIHKVDTKAMQHGEAIKAIARRNAKFRETFPLFVPPRGVKEWDTKKEWRWPCFQTDQATEFSFTAYGETSSKVGGHYFLRCVDDWVDDTSATNPTQLNKSEIDFRSMDNIRERNIPDCLPAGWSPWITVGTHYHYSDTYMRLMRGKGWLAWKMPGHRGSAKTLFDLAGTSDRTQAGRDRIERGLKKLETERADDLNFPTILSWRELYRSLTSQMIDEEGTGGVGSAHVYNCQILLNPVPEGEQRFSHQALDDVLVDEIPEPSEVLVHIRVDPAIGTKRENDECVINVCLIDAWGIRWYVDGWAGREKNPNEVVRRIFHFGKLWTGLEYEFHNVGVESVAYQEALAELCRNGVPEREATYDGERLAVKKFPLNPNGRRVPIISIPRSPELRKIPRILGMSGPVERRMIRIWKNNPIGQKLLQVHKDFPFSAYDILDTCADMWIACKTPPHTLGMKDRRMHDAFKEILSSAMLGDDERPKAVMHNSTKLANWRS